MVNRLNIDIRFVSHTVVYNMETVAIFIFNKFEGFVGNDNSVWFRKMKQQKTVASTFKTLYH
jgi:hypothetical protein